MFNNPYSPNNNNSSDAHVIFSLFGTPNETLNKVRIHLHRADFVLFFELD